MPAVLLAMVLGALFAACGGAATPSIVVSDAWVRAPTGTGSLTAAYFTITNNGSSAGGVLLASASTRPLPSRMRT